MKILTRLWVGTHLFFFLASIGATLISIGGEDEAAGLAALSLTGYVAFVLMRLLFTGKVYILPWRSEGGYTED